MLEKFLAELEVSREVKISLATLRGWRLEGRGIESLVRSFATEKTNLRIG